MTRKLAPVHPGRHLRETLEELGISARQFALHIGTTPMRLSLVLRGMRPVSADGVAAAHDGQRRRMRMRMRKAASMSTVS